MVEAKIKTDLIEATLESWVEEITENFRETEAVIKESGVWDVLAQVRKKLCQDFPFVKLVQAPDLDSKRLEEVASQVKKYPHTWPDLRCRVLLEWRSGEDEIRHFILVNADPRTKALIIAGEEVKRLERKDWQKKEILLTNLMFAINNPAKEHTNRTINYDSY
jgi:hypothetical protein